ncbi:sensor histidine kinase [Streptomyces sp. NPDC058440]|uniref:sensor histidine kinase n=1 Tax=Streptomyces sp. NPDC058440 TaxID=3346501 RepID=UPI0036647956
MPLAQSRRPRPAAGPPARPHSVRSLRRTGVRVAAGVLLLAVLVLEGANTGFVPTAAATTLCGVLAWAALFAPQRHALALGAGAVLCSGALSLVSTQLSHRPENTFGTLELCALLFLVTRSLRIHHPLAAVLLATGAAAAAGLSPLRLPQDAWETLKILEPVIMLSLAPFAALGIYLRMLDQARNRQRLAALTEQRLEYARELHDFVAHHVTAMVTQVKAVRYVTDAGHAPDPKQLDAYLERVESAGTQALRSMREMVTQLRTTGTEPSTSSGTDMTGLQKLTEAFTRNTGIPAHLTVDPGVVADPPDPKVAAAVRHLVQESLTNISRHATGCGRVDVEVHVAREDPGWLRLTVVDDGNGAESLSGEPAGYGLVGLSERFAALGGSVTGGPRSGRPGWQVGAEVPARP